MLQAPARWPAPQPAAALAGAVRRTLAEACSRNRRAKGRLVDTLEHSLAVAPPGAVRRMAGLRKLRKEAVSRRRRAPVACRTLAEAGPCHCSNTAVPLARP